ncbi:anti-sigma factor [Peterkaempfera bronchialis]
MHTLDRFERWPPPPNGWPPPPPEAPTRSWLKSLVLSRIATVRQEPPQTFPSALGRGALVRGLCLRVRSLPRFALAACLVAAGFGGVAVWQHRQAQDARVQAAQVRRSTAELSRVLTAPDAAVRSARLSGAGTGTVVVSRRVDRAVFLAATLPLLRSGEVYQLWFDDAGTMRPAGLLPAPRSSAVAVLLDGPVGRATGVGITVEAAGGSTRPTTAPLALVLFS